MQSKNLPDKLTGKEHVKIWNDILKIIEKSVPAQTYKTWFVPIKPLTFINNTLTIQLPHPLFWEWIESFMGDLINKTIFDVIGNAGKLDYTFPEKVMRESAPQEKRIKLFPQEVVILPSPIFEQEVVELIKSGNQLDAKYSFDNFIRGDGNQLAYAAAMAISQNPGGTPYNPLFLYGGVGLGKTHLIQAIGNAILEREPNKKVFYTFSEKFTVDYVDTILNKTMNEFSNQLRGYDVIMIDDIQYLTGKEKTQDFFFQIFNELHQSRRQIILSSDKPPKDIKGISERLISRFNWGMVADIQPPDFETRLAILNKKAGGMQIRLPNDVLEYIAAQITSNIRELEGCLIKLSLIGAGNITLDLTKKIVREISTAKKINISIDVITRVTSEYLEIDEKKIRDKTRKQEVVIARQISMYLSKILTKSSLKNIGLHFGGRDHSTVIHACTSIENEMLSDKSFKDLVEIIKNKVEIACS